MFCVGHYDSGSPQKLSSQCALELTLPTCCTLTTSSITVANGADIWVGCFSFGHLLTLVNKGMKLYFRRCGFLKILITSCPLLSQDAVEARSSLSIILAPCRCADTDRADPPFALSPAQRGPVSAAIVLTTMLRTSTERVRRPCSHFRACLKSKRKGEKHAKGQPVVSRTCE